MNRFKAKTAIVTGAGSGIGKAIANALVEEGADVMINDINPKLIDAAIAEGKVKGLEGDMSILEDIQELVAYTLKCYGKIDLLVANASVTHFAPFLETTEAEFDKMSSLNMKGTFFLTQIVAKAMKDIGGKIVVISSNLSKRAYPNLTTYSMTKAALNMMVRSLSLELSPYKININALAPGPIATERTIKEIPDYHEVWADIIPTGRSGTVEDTAKSTLFLLSDEASQINGQVLFLDGGWSGIGVNPV